MGRDSDATRALARLGRIFGLPGLAILARNAAPSEKPAVGKTWIQKLKDALETARSILVSVIVIVVGLFVAWVLGVETFSKHLLVEPAGVSADLAKRGYTTQGLGEDLVARVKQLQRESIASAQLPVGLEQGIDPGNDFFNIPLHPPTPVLTSTLLRSGSSLPKVTLPGTGLDATAVLRALRSVTGVPDNKVTVTLASLDRSEQGAVKTAEGPDTEKFEIRMTLRFGGREESHDVKGINLTDTIDQAAMRLMRYSAPESFLLQNLARDRRFHNLEATESSAYQLLVDPDLKQKAWVHGLLAVILHEQGRTGEAVALTRGILVGMSESADHHVFNLVQMLAALKKFDEARRELESARARGAKSELLVVADVLLRLQEDAGVNEGAATAAELEQRLERKVELSLVRQGLADHPGSPLLRNLEGLVLFQAKKFDEAEKAFRQALELSPKYASAAGNLGMVLLTNGDPNRGLQMMRLATELDHRSSVAFSNLGVAYQHLELRKEALLNFENAARINVKSQICFACWANELVNLREYAQAIEKIQLGFAVRPGSSQLHFVWARALAGQKRYPEAIAKLRSVERMIGQRPPTLLAALVNVQIESGLLAEAEKECRASPTGEAGPLVDNACGRALLRRGRADAAAGRFQSAAKGWIARKSEASRKLAAGALNNWADALLRQNKLDEAETKIFEARSLDPSNEVIAMTYAEILLARGRYEDAVVEFETISHQWPTYRTAGFFSAWSGALRKANRPGEAREVERQKAEFLKRASRT